MIPGAAAKERASRAGLEEEVADDQRDQAQRRHSVDREPEAATGANAAGRACSRRHRDRQDTERDGGQGHGPKEAAVRFGRPGDRGEP